MEKHLFFEHLRDSRPLQRSNQLHGTLRQFIVRPRLPSPSSCQVILFYFYQHVLTKHPKQLPRNPIPQCPRRLDPHPPQPNRRRAHQPRNRLLRTPHPRLLDRNHHLLLLRLLPTPHGCYQPSLDILGECLRRATPAAH